MARIPRIIIPNQPHHVTQRGNRRQSTFFQDSDFQHYSKLLFFWCDKMRVRVDAYCLMPNHVHLVLVPSDMCGLTKALTETHRRYTLAINARENWRGCLWQGRFFSVPLDERHYDNAIRYVEMNPVRAGLCSDPLSYEWSSARTSDRSIEFWATEFDPQSIRKMTKSGRPDCGQYLKDQIMKISGVDITKKKSGPKPGGQLKGHIT